MLVPATQMKTTRSGATAVEFAAVISFTVLILFGILEYCLIIYTQNVVEAATREGCRYAVVNSTNSTLVSDTQNVVKSFLGGLDTKNQNYSCSVYQADANGNNIGAPGNATFGQYICVETKLDYKPMTPGLLHLSTFTIRSKCAMGSEAN